MYPIKQGQTAQSLVFLMVDSTDHISPKTGLTPTVTLSKNGTTFASAAGAVSEVGNGFYKLAGNAVDSGTLGPLLLHAVASGADPCDEAYQVVAFDPMTAPVVPPGASVIAAALWTDVTPGDFAVPGSPGYAMASLYGAFLNGSVTAVTSNNIVTVDFGTPVIAANFPVGCYCNFLAGSRANPSKMPVQAATAGVTASQIVLVLGAAWANAPLVGDEVAVG